MAYEFAPMDGVAEEKDRLMVRIGGKNPSDYIKGFKLLNVSGRELIGNDVNFTRNENGDGGVITAESTPIRTLTMQYQLIAEDDDELRESFNLLNAFLRREKGNDMPIVFSDEPNMTFYGRYQQTDEAPSDRNALVSSFSMICVDPYKYREETELVGDGVVVVGNNTPYELKPQIIEIKPTTAINKVVISNNTTGRRIVLNGEYQANRPIEIEIAKNKITSNGQSKMKDLDYLESDFHKFLIKYGDVVEVTPKMELKVKVRGKWL